MIQSRHNFFSFLRHWSVHLILLLAITACATTPDFNLANVDQSIQPRDVVANLDKYRSKKTLWGGLIINSSNVKQGTQLEILSYPLDRNLKPDIEKDTLGRVIVSHEGYLETLDYASGRLLTVVGIVQETKKGMVGEAMYTYPVVKTGQLHLWPQKDNDSDGRVHFGIGVMIH
jgi:outer membrane lipoprotein